MDELAPDALLLNYVNPMAANCWALSEATGIPVNDLPLAIVLSWMEQKAVIILLALFSLGIKHIYLGPKPPQFVNDAILDFLVQTFDLHLTSAASEDLANLLHDKQVA